MAFQGRHQFSDGQQVFISKVLLSSCYLLQVVTSLLLGGHYGSLGFTQVSSWACQGVEVLFGINVFGKER